MIQTDIQNNVAICSLNKGVTNALNADMVHKINDELDKVEIMQDVRERIKQHFFVDQFQLREGPQMTATEVNTRVDMQLRLLGPLLGRLHFEFLQPMVGRMLQIMSRKGLLPENQKKGQSWKDSQRGFRKEMPP